MPAHPTNGARTKTMMTVRTSVAKSESMPLMPTLAKMAVRAAKPAERTAQRNHEEEVDMDCGP